LYFFAIKYDPRAAGKPAAHILDVHRRHAAAALEFGQSA
jgi:hypothetical protein